MTQFNISLPPAVEEYLQQKVIQEGYENPEQYIYHLILEDQKRESKEDLETMLLDGLESGEPIEVTEEWWEQKKAKLIKKMP